MSNSLWPVRRLPWCLLPLLLGGAAVFMLLLTASGSIRTASAAPDTVTFPGCGATIQDCLDTAAVGETIVVQPGTYITSLTLSRAVSLTGVNSATTILQALPAQRVLTVTGAAVDNSVVISGLTFTGGWATGGLCPSGCGGGLLVADDATPALNDLQIVNNLGFDGGGVYATGNITLTNSSVVSNTTYGSGNGAGLFGLGTVTVRGTVFVSNTVAGFGVGGGGVYAAGPVVVSDSAFIGNGSHNLPNGGGLYARAGAVVYGNSLFRENVAVGLGGALYVSGTAVLTDTQLVSNRAGSGGGLYALDSVRLTNAQVVSNTAGASGGGLYTLGDALLTGSDFISNALQSNVGFGGGGGLYAERNVTVTAGSFISNSSTHDGGGLRGGGSGVVSGTLFMGNTASDHQGGGMFVQGPATLVNTQFVGNYSSRGGGLYVITALTMTNSQFTGNSVSLHGGGLYARQVSADQSLFSGNSAVGDGGGMSAEFATLTATHVFQNMAGVRGGGVQADGVVVLAGTQFFTNTAQADGGGLWAAEGAVVTDGDFQGNACTAVDCWGGGLYVDAWLTMTNTSLTANTATRGGGGAATTGPAQVTGGDFVQNACSQAGCWGGGIVTGQAIPDNVPLTVSGAVFRQNSARAGAGALSTGPTHITSSLFEFNAAGSNGGGLVTMTSLTSLSDTQFLSNSSQLNGGGVIAQGSVMVVGGVFQNNQCTVTNCRGGGLWASSLSLSDTVFTANRSASYGGALFVETTGSLSGATFENNQCTEVDCRGGAVYAQDSLTVTAAAFIANSAGTGGAVRQNAGTGTFVNTLFARNQAAQGAALYVNLSANADLRHATIATPTLSSGSAIHLVGSASIVNSIVASYTVGIAGNTSAQTEDYVLFDSVATPVAGFGLGPHSRLGPARFRDAWSDDYHLSLGSAAIDAGADLGVSVDVDGDPRPLGGGFDAGFDEYSDGLVFRLFLPFIRR